MTALSLPTAPAVAAVLESLGPEAGESELAAALSAAFPPLVFTAAGLDDPYWRDTLEVVGADGSRLGDFQEFVESELAAAGTVQDLWERLRASGHRLAEWRGRSVYAFAATGPGVADYLQLALEREAQIACPVVDPNYPPRDLEQLLRADWIFRGDELSREVLSGPRYRLQRSPVVHLQGLLRHLSASPRRPERPLSAGLRQIEDRAAREVRFFADWQASSASEQRIFAHWALDIRETEDRGERMFIPRPLRRPAARLTAEKLSVPQLMDRIERLDREQNLPFAWYFLMLHGHWVEAEVGQMIAASLRAGRTRLPDRHAAVLMKWAERPYGF